MNSSSDDDYVPHDDMDDTDAYLDSESDSLIEEDYVPEEQEPFYEMKDRVFEEEVTCDALERLGNIKISIEAKSRSKIEHDLDEWLATESIDDMRSSELVEMFRRYDDAQTRAPFYALFGDDARDVFACTVSSHGFRPVHKEILSPRVVVEMLLDRIDRRIGQDVSWDLAINISNFSKTIIEE